MYEVETIQLSLGESKRPQQIAVYKSGPDGGFDQLVPWLYMVTDQSECMTQFDVPVKQVPDSVDAVLCQPYPTDVADINEQVNRRSTSIRPVCIINLFVKPLL